MRPKCRSSGKISSCMRQERAAGIDHVDAGQIVLPRDILRAQMLLHGHRIIGAALDGGVVGDDDAFAARNAPDAGDDAGGMDVAAIEAVGRQRRQFEKRGAGIDQQVDALARQHLAARGMPGARSLAAAAGHHLELFAKLGDEAAHRPRRCGQIRRRWDRWWNEAAWSASSLDAGEPREWPSVGSYSAAPQGKRTGCTIFAATCPGHGVGRLNSIPAAY